MISNRVRQIGKYTAIQELHEKKNYPVWDLCALVGCNRSSYYKWLRRNKSASEIENEQLLERIREKYKENNGILGYRRMTLFLNREFRTHYNCKRIYRLMKAAGLQSVIRRKRPQYLRSTPKITAENKLNREFRAESINQKWLTDVTVLRYGHSRHKAYLSAILDLKDRRIVSWVLGTDNNNQLVFKNFDSAVAANPGARPLFHSDRGYQYTSKEFKDKLDQTGMVQSMSRIGRCIDNGPMEGFFGILKCEMYYLSTFDSYEALHQAVADFMQFYNFRRFQPGLHGLSPMEYQLSLLTV